MGNSVLFNTAGSIALAVNYTIQGPYSDKFITKQAAKVPRINAELFVRVGNAIISVEDDEDMGVADLDAGADFAALTTYYIYACHPLSGLDPVFKITENATFPAGGWSALTSRKIGGFETDAAGEIVEATLWDLRTVDITIAGVTDDMIPAAEISAGKVQFSTYFQRGAGVFAGSTGVTIAITDVGGVDYHVAIVPAAQSDYIGQISVESKAANSFVVKNSGSDVATAFDWILNTGY